MQVRLLGAAGGLIVLGISVLGAAPVVAAASPSPAPTPYWTYLAFGDSYTYGKADECGGCVNHPSLVADMIWGAMGIPITLIDASQHNKLTSAGLAQEIATDDWGFDPEVAPVRSGRLTPREAIAAADIISVSVGANDMPWQFDTDPCGGVYDTACARRIVEPYASDLDSILTQIETIRAGRPTAIRVTTNGNELIGGGHFDPTPYFSPGQVAQALTGVRDLYEGMLKVSCDVAARHHAICVDMYHVFNGPDGTSAMAEGYFTPQFGDLNQRGQDEIAIEIMKLGFSPLTAP